MLLELPNKETLINHVEEEIGLTFQPDIRLKESILKTIFTPANSKTGKPLGATTAQFTQSCRVVISRRSCSPLRAFIRYFSRFFFANNICKTPTLRHFSQSEKSTIDSLVAILECDLWAPTSHTNAKHWNSDCTKSPCTVFPVYKTGWYDSTTTDNFTV